MLTLEQLSNTMQEGEFAWPGGYQKYAVGPGGATCWACLVENLEQIMDATKPENQHNGWRVDGVEANWEDPNLFCDCCGKRIPSCYAEPDEQETPSQP